MSKYYVKYNDLNNQADSLQNISKAIATFEGQLNSIVNNMDASDSSMYSLKNQLRNCGKDTRDIYRKISTIGITVKNISDSYLKFEKSNYYNIQNSKLWNSDEPLLTKISSLGSYLLTNGYVDTATLGFKTSDSIAIMQLTKGMSTLEFLKGSSSIKTKDEYGIYKDPNAIKINERTKNTYDQYAYDKETGQILFYGMAPGYAKKGVTIFDKKIEGKLGGSILEYSNSGKANWGEGSVNAKAGTAELHGKLTGGLYVFDKDNKKKLAPSISAEVGASVSALSIAASGKIGSEMLGGYGGVNAAAGKLEAKATADAAIFNENGELNIQAKAKASAEAIAAEAKGRAGVTVLGIDAGVSGSVNIGVGAHAEAGIVDGIVKVDIGASLGVGASVGFEIDIGGAIDAVCGGAKSAWGALTKIP